MHTKILVRWVLLVFVAAGVAWAAWGPGRRASDAPAAAPPVTHPTEPPGGRPAARAPRLVVYYFHGDRRCATCRSIEAGAHEALQSALAAELASGDVAWRAVNTDATQNAHFVEDYALVASSLVLVDGRGAHWKNLDRVWELAHEPAEFRDYVVAAARDGLAGRW